MNIVKIAKASRIPPRKLMLLLEASGRASVAVLAIYLVPFKWWSPHLLGRRILDDINNEQSSAQVSASLDLLPEVLKDVRWAVLRVSRVFGGRLTCLAQAVCGKALLARRGIDSVVVLGVRTGGSQSGESGASDGLGAHAWLCVSDIVLLGDEARAGHIPVARYGAMSVPTASAFGETKRPH